MIDNLLSLMETTAASDFELVVGEKPNTQTFKVHRSIISAESPMLATACKKRAFKEGKEGRLVLPAIDPGSMKIILQYLYTKTVPELELQREPKADVLDENINYQQPLTPQQRELDWALSKEWVCRILGPELSRSTALMKHADFLGIINLKKFALKRIKSIFKKETIMFSNGELKELVLTTTDVLNTLSVVLSDDYECILDIDRQDLLLQTVHGTRLYELLGSSRFRELVTQNAQFAYDLIVFLSQRDIF